MYYQVKISAKRTVIFSFAFKLASKDPIAMSDMIAKLAETQESFRKYFATDPRSGLDAIIPRVKLRTTDRTRFLTTWPMCPQNAWSKPVTSFFSAVDISL